MQLIRAKPCNLEPLNKIKTSDMVAISTLSIHAADESHRVSDVTPPINISTTYRYDSDPAKLKTASEIDGLGDDVVYSRLSHHNGVLVEETIGAITKSEAVIYSSGLGAFNAAMAHLNPKKLFIGQAYHGCHGIADIMTRNYGLKQLSLSEEDLKLIEEGDLIHIETPVNPNSWCFDIQKFADLAHEKGAKLLVDSTFAPLQDPFEFGADMVMHSATKYFGGHSDLLAGLLLTKDKEVKKALQLDRVYLGTNIGNLEASLLFRSLKTFELRVKAQSASAEIIAKHLQEKKESLPKLLEVHHSSLQSEAFVAAQLKGIHSPTFSIIVDSAETARLLPSKLKYFYHATSLGGAESLIEWRCMSDVTAPPGLLRISVGLENVDDLIGDLVTALE
ncbi:hypothetical protein PUMCH_002096 [Australozyma saopauloensis]|uniref:Cystathionine gamma-synthase n=1 Tax=Australozyma saopauloensis TaxID=291208 RepID=A0AAX4H890_9ASCO|nr:hypothetical protein PUMCH_002096 [[Candida] saopauloensis]